MNRWAPRLTAWLAPLLAAVAVWSATASLRHALEAIDYPFQLDPIESKILQSALWVQRGEPLYRGLGEEPPWVVANYTPLYPWLCSLGISERLPTLCWPRTLSLAGAVLSGLALGALLWRGTHSWSLALLAPALWWSSYEVFMWTPYARVDLLALALSALALTWASFCLGRWTWPRVLGVSALFCLAWLTRQSQVLLPAALVTWLLVTDRIWAWRLAAVWGGGVALLAAGLTLGTGGRFWTLTVTYNVNLWSRDQMLIWVNHLLAFWPPLPWMLALGALGAGLQRRGREGRLSAGAEITGLLTCAAGWNTANVVATGKAGAALNYLLEPLWCLLGLVTVLWFQLAAGACGGPECRPSGRSSILRALVFGLFTGLFTLLALTAATSRIPGAPVREGLWPHRSLWRSPISDHERRRDLEIESAFRSAEGPVLAEYGIYALRAGHDLVWEPFLMSQLTMEGRWDEAPLLERVRGGDFALILLRDDVANSDAFDFSVTPAFAGALRSAYVEARSWPGTIPLHLWRPRGLTAASPASE